MQFNEFADLAVQKMMVCFPKMEMHLQRVEKLQGQSYNALVVKSPDDEVGMTFNMDGFYRKWRDTEAERDAGCGDESLDVVFTDLAETIRRAEPHPPMVDVEALRSYRKMRECLSMQLVPVKGNEEMLAKVPHKIYGDLAIVYRFVFPGSSMEEASVLLTHDLLLTYEVTEQQLEEDAFLICPANHPMVIKNMEEVLLGICPDAVGDEDGPKCDLWVISNNLGRNGASAVFYPGALDSIAAQLGCGFYLIPSSVHEMLAIPDPVCMGATHLDKMVESVNETEVSEEDRLTDHCYHYDPEKRRLETGKEYEARHIGDDCKEKMFM